MINLIYQTYVNSYLVRTVNFWSTLGTSLAIPLYFISIAQKLFKQADFILITKKPTMTHYYNCNKLNIYFQLQFK